MTQEEEGLSCNGGLQKIINFIPRCTGSKLLILISNYRSRSIGSKLMVSVVKEKE